MTQDVRDLWMEVRGRLRTFIARRVEADAAVDDLLQEVFLRIHDKIDSLQDPPRLVSWIFQITRHVIIDYYRAPHRQREVPAGLAPEVEEKMPPAEQDNGSDEPRAQLAGCLRPMVEQLPADYREAIRLVELEGLTQQTAAARTTCNQRGNKMSAGPLEIPPFHQKYIPPI